MVVTKTTNYLRLNPTSTSSSSASSLRSNDETLTMKEKITSMYGLRLSFHRSVSFMKKSRNGSSSDIGSMNSTSCTDDSSIASFNDSSTDELIIINDQQQQQQPQQQQPYCYLRSCMKGTRLKKTKKTADVRRVRFYKTKHNKIQIIEPYFEFAADLWYTKKDEQEIFSQPENDLDPINAELYMNTLTQARREVYPTYYMECSDPVPARPELLSSSLYDEIVRGRIHGYAGLEQYCSKIKRIRRTHIRNVVFSVVNVYYDCVHNNVLTDNEVSTILRLTSKSLSTVDRYWATAIGHADADAVSKDQQKAVKVVAIAA